MKKFTILFLLALFIFIISVTGCLPRLPGTPYPTPTPSNQTWITPTPTTGWVSPNPTSTTSFEYSLVKGIVTDGRSGPGLAGAEVTMYVAGVYTASATTDDSGYYMLDAPANQYFDLVVTKPGYASSRFQDLYINPGETLIANIVQLKVFNSNWSVEAPRATITGVSPYDYVSNTLNVTISLTGGQDPYNGTVYWSVGSESPDHQATGYPFQFNHNTMEMPDGLTYYYIIAYDLNNNCVINRVPVVVYNYMSACYGLVMYNPIFVIAITEGDDMQFNRLNQSNLIKSKKMKTLFTHLADKYKAKAAELNSACYVYLEWEPEFESNPYFRRYKIYQSVSGNPYELIGYSMYDDINDFYYFFDHTPAVTPGVTLDYRVVPVSKDGTEGSWMSATVTPLGRFEVNLFSPHNNEINVPLTPDFRWINNGLNADSYTYSLKLSKLTSSNYCSTTYYTESVSDNWLTYDHNNWTDGFALERSRQYQWDIDEAFALKTFNQYSLAVSVGVKGYSLGSYNGAAVFTTTP